MGRILVTVSGHTGAGKDTFISHLSERLDLQRTEVLSSIDPVARAMKQTIYPEIGMVFKRTELTDTDRHVLSEIKATLDIHLDYTSQYVREVFKEGDDTDVLIMQVREIAVVARLKEYGRLLELLGWQTLPIWIERPAHTPALKDRTLPQSDMQKANPRDFGLYVINTSLKVLPHYADIAAEMIKLTLAGEQP